jgi:hypothetical protein
VFVGDESIPAGASKSQRSKYRPVREREALARALVVWREKALDQHPHQAVVTRRWILPNDTITALSRVRTSSICGPETVSEIADRTDEWVSMYAPDIHNVIAQFDEEWRVRKLCARLSHQVGRKVRSVAWRKRILNRYEENAELALTAAEGARDDMAKFKRAVRKEKRLLVLGGMTGKDIGEMKRRTNARCSELRRNLENAIWDLQERCESLREAIVWSNVLNEGDNVETESGNVRKVTVYVPPPVQTSKH